MTENELLNLNIGDRIKVYTGKTPINSKLLTKFKPANETDNLIFFAFVKQKNTLVAVLMDYQDINPKPQFYYNWTEWIEYHETKSVINELLTKHKLVVPLKINSDFYSIF